MTIFALFLAALAGVGIPEALKPHAAKGIVAAVVLGIGGAATATKEWTWVIVGALIGALVGVLVEKFPGGSIRERASMFVASLGTSTMVSVQAMNWLGLDHEQPTVLLVSFVCAFAAWPVLKQARAKNWAGTFLAKWIPQAKDDPPKDDPKP
jgi:uncharacterized membrane protein YeaQ/YmgE (transglycosylase-associated protein family)